MGVIIQEFNLEICDNKGVENLITDHISRIDKDGEVKPMESPTNDAFLDEFLYTIKIATTL